MNSHPVSLRVYFHHDKIAHWAKYQWISAKSRRDLATVSQREAEERKLIGAQFDDVCSTVEENYDKSLPRMVNSHSTFQGDSGYSERI